jgi:site-specific DNA-methyltransferase (adenine-specific)
MTSPQDFRSTTVGRQVVIHGDCLDVLRKMATASVDEIITSIPYNVGAPYNQYDDRQRREFYLAKWAACVTELYRVLKPTGSFFFNFGIGTRDDPTLPDAVKEVILQAGFVPQNRIIWVKSIAINDTVMGQYKPLPGDRYLNRTHEEIIHYTKTGDVRLSRNAIGVAFADKSNIDRYEHAEDLKCGGTVWFMPQDTVQSKAGKFNHPATFPVELPLRCIKLHGSTRIEEEGKQPSSWFVPPDLVVLDPCVGVGTTLVAAQQLGCIGIGIEMDSTYVATAIQRLMATPTTETAPSSFKPTSKVSRPSDPPVPTAALSSPPDLLRAAQRAGAQVRLCGGQIEFWPGSRLSPELREALQAHRHAIWRHLGGDTLDAPPTVLLHQLEVGLLIPANVSEALEAIAQVEADADRHDSLIGLDIETAALPGAETRPPIKLKKNGEPMKAQPAFTGTAALDPHRSRIRLVQIYGGGTHCLILDTDRVPIDLIAPMFERHTAVIHNASFELRFFGSTGIAVPLYEDTMQAAGLLLGVRHRSLEAVAGAYLGIDLPKNLQNSDWSAPQLSPGQYAYAALDSIIAFRLWPKLSKELAEKGRETAYQLQRDVTRVAVQMVDRGIALDRGRHQQQIDEWRTTLASTTRTFQHEAGRLPPNTPAETIEYLKKVLPPEVLENWPTTKKSGAMSTKASDMKRHVAQIPAIRDLLEIRATQKLLNSFGDDLLDKISARTGRLHPGLNIASAKTGRSSSSNPNIQQIPKHKAPALRAAMVAGIGSTFVIGDYNAMELRAAGEVSNDHVFRQDFADGIDPHRRQAATMLGIPEGEVTSDQRDAAKPINFGTIYGAGPNGLAASAWNGYGILITPDEAGAGRQAFLNRYYMFARWMRAHYERCTEAGRIEIGCYGRVIEAAWEAPKTNGWHRPDNDDEVEEDEDDLVDWTDGGWAAAESSLRYTLCCNAPVQGACADAGMLALLLADAAFKRENINGGLVLFVHDELVAEVQRDQATRAAELLRTSMQQAFTAVFPDAPVNGLVEIKIRDTWGNTTEKLW